MPDLGLVIQDAETGEQMFVDTTTGLPPSASARSPNGARRELRAAFRQAGVDALELATDDGTRRRADALCRPAQTQRARDQGPAASCRSTCATRSRRHLDEPTASGRALSFLWMLLPRCRPSSRCTGGSCAGGKAVACATPTCAVKRRDRRGPRWRRHVPPALFLARGRAMIVAVARPRPWSRCRRSTTRSFSRWTCPGMRPPRTSSPTGSSSRRRNAARAFIADQPSRTRIAIVVVRRHGRGGPGADEQPART